MIKSQIRKHLSKYPKYTVKKLVDKIGKYQYVSFDVFDTLIKRSIGNPDILFRLLSEDYKDDNFYRLRKEAEQIARRKALLNGQEEINIGQIYCCMPAPYCNELMTWVRAEIEKEIMVCYANRLIKEVYEWCVSEKKTIIITSDMYLPGDAIRAILSKCGYSDYNRLYLSSEIGLKKKTGHLYSRIIEDLGIQAKELIHIGDSIISDFQMARNRGVNAVLIARENHGSTLFCSYRGIEHNEKDKYKKLKLFLQNNISSRWNGYYQFGYEAFGPLLYGFARWLSSEMKKNKLEKVFFFSRDGYIMQKAYNELTGKTEDSHYIYVSRRSLRVPQIWLNPELSEVVETFPQVTMLSMKAFIKNIGLNFDEYKNKIEDFGLKGEDTFKRYEIINNEKLARFYESIKKDVINNSKNEYNLLVDYLHQEDFHGNIAVVDIGWYGSLQFFLEKIIEKAGFDTRMHGYYIGLTKEQRGKIIAKGYVNDNLNTDFCDSWRGFSGLIEYLFLAQEGSTKTYRRNEDGIIEPVKYTYEYGEDANRKAEADHAHDIQEGAIRFIRDVIENKGFQWEINCRTAYSNIRNAGNYPTDNVCKLFGNIRFLEETPVYLANPDSFISYLKNPKKFKKDFYYSKWKIGFMKKLFYIPLPYNKIYELIKK